MTRRLTRGRAGVLAGLTASVLTLGVALGAPTTAPAGAQTTEAPATATVDVVAVSPWVAPDGTWSARLRIGGAPTGARLSYSIRQPPTGTEADIRSALIAARGGDEETRLMRSAVTVDLSTATGPDGITQLDIPIRSGSGARDRVLIPNRGAYPVVVTVVAPDGTTVGRQTLSLNRLPDDDRRPFSLGLTVDAPAVDAFDDEGRPQVTPALRAAATSLIDRVAATGGVALRVALHPSMLVALDASTLEADAALVERLAAVMTSTTVTGSGWGDLDVEAWARAGALSTVQTSVSDGQEAAFLRLRRPVDTRLWPLDDTVGPASVPLLTRLGASALIVDPDRLQSGRPPGGESGFTRPFRITGDDGASLVGLAVDPEIEDLLETGDADPPLAVHQVLTQLFAAWTTDTRQRGAVLRLGPAVDPDVIKELTSVLGGAAGADGSGAQPFDVVDPVAVSELSPITSGSGSRETTWSRQLTPREGVPDVGALAARLATARPLIDDYAAVMPDGDEAAARYAVVAQRAVDRNRDPAASVAAVDDVVAAIRSDLGRITAPQPRTIWVTSRLASIPLRFTNDTGRPVRVRLRLQSPRLIFTDGSTQDLTLQPGVNRVAVGVDVRASGQFLMQAEIVAPDSDRVLASTRQRIRSRAFSGVGLMLSGGALLFLVIWWTRTLRRRGRTGDDGGAGARGDDDGPVGADDTDGEPDPVATTGSG